MPALVTIFWLSAHAHRYQILHASEGLEQVMLIGNVASVICWKLLCCVVTGLILLLGSCGSERPIQQPEVDDDRIEELGDALAESRRFADRLGDELDRAREEITSLQTSNSEMALEIRSLQGQLAAAADLADPVEQPAGIVTPDMRAAAWAQAAQEELRLEQTRWDERVRTVTEQTGPVFRVSDTDGNTHVLRGCAFSIHGRAGDLWVWNGGLQVGIPIETLRRLVVRSYTESGGRIHIADVELRNGEVLASVRVDTSFGLFQGKLLSTGSESLIPPVLITRIERVDDGEVVRLIHGEGGPAPRIEPILAEAFIRSATSRGGYELNDDAHDAIKSIVLNTYNPFAPADQLQRDTDRLVRAVFESP